MRKNQIKIVYENTQSRKKCCNITEEMERTSSHFSLKLEPGSTEENEPGKYCEEFVESSMPLNKRTTRFLTKFLSTNLNNE